MKRLILIMACLAIVAVLAAPAALAAQTTTWLPAVKAQTQGGMVKRPNIPVDPDPVSMHGMKSSSGPASEMPAAKAGPTDMGSDLRGPRGSALVTPTGGGPMYSPKEQGDVEITRLIKKLG